MKNYYKDVVEGFGKEWTKFNYSNSSIAEQKNILNNYFKSGLFHLSGHKTNKYNLLSKINKFYKLKKVIHKDSSIKIDRSLLHKKFYNSFNFKIKNWQKLIKELNDDYKINKKLLYQK